jgi:hypothetical protein
MLPFAGWVAVADDTLNTSTGGTASSAQRASDILNVRDFEPLALATLPPTHLGYLATGIDDDNALRRAACPSCGTPNIAAVSARSVLHRDRV